MRWIAKTFTLLLFLLFSVGLDASVLVPETLKNTLASINPDRAELRHNVLFAAGGLKNLYEQRNYEAVWNESTANDFLSNLENAEQQGLNPFDYHLNALRILLVYWPREQQTLAELEILLSDAFLSYTSHLNHGKLNEEDLSVLWFNPNAKLDYGSLLREVGSGIAPSLLLKSVVPKEENYQHLLTELHRWQANNNDNCTFVSEGPTLRIGESDERIASIKKILLCLGDLPDWKHYEFSENFYDEALEDAVIRFQSRHGLDADGAIGNKTIQALNISSKQRVDMLRINLERWRWIHSDLSPYYILVQIPDFRLKVYRNNEIIAEHKVMVGKKGRETPTLKSRLSHLVVNPSWTIPPTILKKDVLPEVMKDPSYLNQKHITVIDRSGQVLNPSQINWEAQEVRGFTYRQPPGYNNALGVIKFMFPNSASVYLHDTPSKGLFRSTSRAFSSGCVRVENPLGLAALILNDEQLDESKLRAMVGSEQSVLHPQSRPDIFITYFTVDALGPEMKYLPDIYDKDPEVLVALNRAAPVYAY